MNKITSLSEYSEDPLVTLRAGALLIQDVIKQQFSHENSKKLLDNKKIGMVATEQSEADIFCVISTLCESLDFSTLEQHVVYDYNNERNLILKKHLGTEVIPVLRVVVNEDKSKALIIEDKIKYDFFSFGLSAKTQPSLLYQLIANKEILRTVSNQKISNIYSIISHRELKPINNYSQEWRNKFIEMQREHIRIAEKENNLKLLERYELGLQEYFHLK